MDQNTFNHYLQEEDDKPYYSENSLSYYYDKMAEFARKVETVDSDLAARLRDWDMKLETFPEGVTELLNQWVADGTIDPVIDQAILITKADQSTVDQLTEQVNTKVSKTDLQQISLSYKESYATVDSLKTAYPTGSPYNHVVLADKMIYTWDGKNWISTQVQANGSGIAEKSIQEIHTTFIENRKSANLFNKNSASNVDGSYLNVSTGAVVASTAYGYSHSIPLVVGKTYKYPVYPGTFGASANRLPLYGSDGTFIGYEVGTLTADNLYNVVTVVNPNAKTTKVNYGNRDTAIPRKEAFMFAENAVYPAVYEEYLNEFKFKPGLLRESELIPLIEQHASGDENLLTGKKATFNGDSISHGGSAADGLSGWAGRIGTKNSMIWENRSVGGGTIAAETYASNGAKKHWIVQDIVNMMADADYVILEGGTNDADILTSAGIGSISNGYSAVLDELTFSGALESTFKQAILKYPGKKIGYIIPHKMGGYGNSVTLNRRAFFDRAIEICKKWGVPYLDLWNTVYFNSDIPEIRTKYYTDSQHLNSLGYEVITPKIEAWMKTL